MLGLNLSLLTVAIRKALAVWTPATLFAASEQGVWYDPSDLSTLFQDSAGTTPVTAVEQPVGLMLDKRLGLVRGPELATNGTFDGGIAGWAVFGDAASTISWNNGRLAISAATTFDGAAQTISGLVVGAFYEISVSFTRGSATALQVRLNPAPAAQSSGTSGVIRQIVQATATSQQLQVTTASNTGTAEFDNISVRELPGNHAFQPTAADRPILRQDAGGRYYLSANGVNTWMRTNSIDFTGTDKVTVFAGVRKLSDAAAGILIELSGSVNNNGSFNVTAPPSINPRFGAASKGSLLTAVDLAASVAAPISAVLTSRYSISGDLLSLRANAGSAIQSTADQGSGNFGNYPLYLFRRGGTSLPFNGHFYGALIRGALCTDPQIAAMERWLAPKTGVTI